MTDQIQKEIDAAGGTDATVTKNAKAPAVKKAPAKKGKAKAKPEAKPEAKAQTAAQLQAAADKAVKAEEKAAEKAAADKVKADEAKVKADKALVVKTERGVVPLIKAGLKAMHMVGKGNKEWTIAAFHIREMCKGTPVKFAEVMTAEWGVAANTASKLANAGELMHQLTTSEEQDVQAQLEYMPMGSINNLSTLSKFGEKKMEVGIDKGVIKMDATEADISEFNRDYNDKGVKVVVKDVPATPAAQAEDAAGVEASSPSTAGETVEQARTRILALTAAWSDDDVITLIEDLERQHKLVTEGE
jgi:hypothetical protein